MQMINGVPRCEKELLARCEAIAGLSLSQLAQQMGCLLPPQPKYAKGWVGQLIEAALGANSGSKPQPDFVDLGIELKTLPLNAHGKPKESTYVCTAAASMQASWQQSHVYRKLARVLWIPVEADPRLAFAERRIGDGILWRPNAEQNAQLQQDWQELNDMLILGEIDQITARHGHYLQLRPKAANGKSLTMTFDEEGNQVKNLPRGYYLRPLFTEQILQGLIK